MIRVLEDKIAIRALDTSNERTSSGLYIAPSADNAQIIFGEVVAVGPDCKPWGEEQAPVVVGSIVHFNKFTSALVSTKRDGRLYVIKLSEVLAVE